MIQNEKLILSLQRRLATLCSLEQKLKEQHAVLAEAYRDRLQARRTKRLLNPTSTDRTAARSGRADARTHPACSHDSRISALGQWLKQDCVVLANVFPWRQAAHGRKISRERHAKEAIMDQRGLFGIRPDPLPKKYLV